MHLHAFTDAYDKRLAVRRSSFDTPRSSSHPSTVRDCMPPLVVIQIRVKVYGVQLHGRADRQGIVVVVVVFPEELWDAVGPFACWRMKSAFTHLPEVIVQGSVGGRKLTEPTVKAFRFGPLQAGIVQEQVV